MFILFNMVVGVQPFLASRTTSDLCLHWFCPFGGMAKRKLYGGCQQQIEQLREEEDRGPSKLAKTLVQKWSWGKFSAPEVQELAQAAYEDGLEMEDIKKLAAIGGWGKRAGNMQRDFDGSFAEVLYIGKCYYNGEPQAYGQTNHMG